MRKLKKKIVFILEILYIKIPLYLHIKQKQKKIFFSNYIVAVITGDNNFKDSYMIFYFTNLY